MGTRTTVKNPKALSTSHSNKFDFYTVYFNMKLYPRFSKVWGEGMEKNVILSRSAITSGTMTWPWLS